MFGDVAVSHPAAWVGDVEQDVDGLARATKLDLIADVERPVDLGVLRAGLSVDEPPSSAWASLIYLGNHGPWDELEASVIASSARSKLRHQGTSAGGHGQLVSNEAAARRALSGVRARPRVPDRMYPSRTRCAFSVSITGNERPRRSPSAVETETPTR